MYSLHAHLKVGAAFGRHAPSTAILYFHKHSGFVPEETFLNNQLSASGDAIPGWRRPRCLGLPSPKRRGQAERYILTGGPLGRAHAQVQPISLRSSLPRNFPAVAYFRAPTASFKGWRGPEHLGEEVQSPSTREPPLTAHRIRPRGMAEIKQNRQISRRERLRARSHFRQEKRFLEGVKKSSSPVILSAAKNLQLFVFKKIKADSSLRSE